MKFIANYGVDVRQSANLSPKQPRATHSTVELRPSTGLGAHAAANALIGLLGALAAFSAHAQAVPNAQAPAALGVQAASVVEVTGAWVRPTVPGQKGTGGFLSLTSKAGTQLVGISSSVAGVSEVHEMAMEGGVMKMRALPFLDLPAGKTVELKPGGHHLMLMDLKHALPLGSEVPVTLVFRDKAGKEQRQDIKIPVARNAVGAAAPAASAQGDHSRHKH